MNVVIQVIPPLPPEVNTSYGDFQFAKLGVLCWQYADPGNILPGFFSGEVEWINQLNFISESKLPNPVAFKYWFQPGVTAIITPRAVIANVGPNIFVNGTAFNLTNGLNMAEYLLKAI